MKRIVVISTFIFLFLFSFASASSATVSIEDTVSVVVVADSTELAQQAVLAYGGQVYEHLNIIAAVSADVPTSQLAALEADDRVSLVHEDAIINFGAVIDENMGQKLRVTVIATGFPTDNEIDEPAHRAARGARSRRGPVSTPGGGCSAASGGAGSAAPG